jgi:hypothetical protein
MRDEVSDLFRKITSIPIFTERPAAVSRRTVLFDPKNAAATMMVATKSAGQIVTDESLYNAVLESYAIYKSFENVRTATEMAIASVNYMTLAAGYTLLEWTEWLNKGMYVPSLPYMLSDAMNMQRELGRDTFLDPAAFAAVHQDVVFGYVLNFLATHATNFEKLALLFWYRPRVARVPGLVREQQVVNRGFAVPVDLDTTVDRVLDGALQAAFADDMLMNGMIQRHVSIGTTVGVRFSGAEFFANYTRNSIPTYVQHISPIRRPQRTDDTTYTVDDTAAFDLCFINGIHGIDTLTYDGFNSLLELGYDRRVVDGVIPAGALLHIIVNRNLKLVQPSVRTYTPS